MVCALKISTTHLFNWTYMCNKYVLINPDMNSSLSTHDDHGAHTHTQACLLPAVQSDVLLVQSAVGVC